MSAPLPLVQENGLPFDLFIQSLTEQLDRAQAAMAIKARVAKLPMTFAVKELSLDLRAFVNIIDDDLFVRPAGPGDADASTLRLSLTTITRPMIEENAVDYHLGDPKMNLKDALGDSMSDSDQRKLERIGVNTVQQLNELKRTVGADVIARLSRMPVNRLQQALMRAAAPRITHVESRAAPALVDRSNGLISAVPTRTHLGGINLFQSGQLPLIRAAGRDVPVVVAQDHELVLEPHASQLGMDAEVQFADGSVLSVRLPELGSRAGATP